MSFNIEGKIIGIDDIQSFDSGAKKITFQVETPEQYNNIYSFELFKGAEHAKHVDNFTTYQTVGDNVKVEFNIKSNEWKGKYYTSLSVWKIEKIGATQQADTVVDDGDDDLPF